jgi:hypothetical protein
MKSRVLASPYVFGTRLYITLHCSSAEKRSSLLVSRVYGEEKSFNIVGREKKIERKSSKSEACRLDGKDETPQERQGTYTITTLMS